MARGIFQAVGKDGEDHLVGAIFPGEPLDAVLEILDGPTDGIEQGRGIAGDLGLLVQIDHLVDRQIVDGNLVTIVEEHQGEPGDAFDLFLLAEEIIETGNGGFDVRTYGSGPVHDEGNLGEGGRSRCCAHD